jgi:hypothetical protein
VAYAAGADGVAEGGRDVRLADDVAEHLRPPAAGGGDVGGWGGGMFLFCHECSI